MYKFRSEDQNQYKIRTQTTKGTQKQLTRLKKANDTDDNIPESFSKEKLIN